MKNKAFRQELKNKKIDFALFYNLDSQKGGNDLIYFAGYRGVGALIIPKIKKPFLVVPEMEYGRVKDRIKVYRWPKKKRLFEHCLYLINKNKIKKKRIGINKNVFTLSVYKLFKKYFKKNKMTDISKLIEKTREIKSKEEIENIKKACKITDKVFSLLIKNIKNKKLKTELSVVDFIEKEAKKFNCELAFNPVVASGKGAGVPHYEAKNIRLRKGFCVIDLGVKYQNYNSDMTRTIYIGKPSKKEKELYYFLLKIQENTIKNIKITDSCGKIHHSVNKRLKNYAKYFNHGLGHGVGINIHELPNLTEKSKDRIQKNTVFTIEPGIYKLNKFGMRIEDTVLMKDKAVRLTKSTKDLLTV